MITNKNDNKSYIGQTIDYKRRMSDHRLCRDKYCLHNAIQKHGWDNFEAMILCEVEDCLADITERAYIKYFKTLSPGGYNLTEGGQNTRGHITLEVRAKISAACAGRPGVNKGRPMTEEAKAKSKESHQKYAKKIVRSDGVVFCGVKEAARQHGVTQGAMHCALKKGRKCKGYGWKFL